MVRQPHRRVDPLNGAGTALTPGRNEARGPEIGDAAEPRASAPGVDEALPADKDRAVADLWVRRHRVAPRSAQQIR